MRKESQSISIGKKGMNRDSSPASLQETEYSFALNTIYESEAGDSYNPQNESSNILAAKFEEGFKVVGHKNDIQKDRTFFMLTNPETNISQIGYIRNNTRNTNLDNFTPLENQEQQPYSEFTVLLEDSCNQCLNFDVNFPIKKIALKDEKQGSVLYWADNKNGDRVLDLKKVEEYTKDGCIDCNKLRIDKKHTLPSITPVSIEAGGQLEKGVYEVTLTYCDKLGNEIAEYISTTNPIHIFDNNDRTMDVTELNDKTNQAIKLRVEDLDTQYRYYKAVIVQKLSDSVSYFVEGIHPINDKEIIIYTVQGKERTDINNILATKTTYVKSEGVTSSNGYLFRYGLTAEKEWNLQPVTNLLGSFVKWQTVKAREDLYEKGEAAALYKGYYRDEVYPLGIRFETNSGYKTALFPLVSRPATTYIDEDNSVIEEKGLVEDNLDLLSANKYNPACSTEDRNQHWQLYNTAHDVEKCADFSGETLTTTEAVRKYTLQENIDVFTDGILYLDVSRADEYTNLKDFIEEYGLTPEEDIPEPGVPLQSGGGSVEHIIYDEGTGTAFGEWGYERISGDAFIMQNIDPRGTDSGRYNMYFPGRVNGKQVVEFSPLAPLEVEGEVKLSYYHNAHNRATLGNKIKFAFDVFITTQKNEKTYVGLINREPAVEGQHETPTVVVEHEDGIKTIEKIRLTVWDGDNWQGWIDNVRLHTKLKGGIDDEVDLTIDYENDELQAFLDDLREGQNELPLLEDTCELVNRAPIQENIEIGEVEEEKVFFVKKEKYNYKRSRVADYIEIHRMNVEGKPEEDEDIPSIYKRSFTKTLEPAYAIELNIKDEAHDGGMYYVMPYAKSRILDGILRTEKSVASGGGLFSDTLHQGALWFRGSLRKNNEVILEISHMNDSAKKDILTNLYIRVTFYSKRMELIQSKIIRADEGYIFADEGEIIAKELYGDEVYIAIDAPLVEVNEWFVTNPPSGSFGIELREVENAVAIVEFKSLPVHKREVYEVNCEVEIPVFDECEPQPHESGKFAYWESTETYPPNEELYDSSKLTIRVEDIPEHVSEDFKKYFVSSEIDGVFVLKEDVDLTNKPIRHFKFPDFNTAPFMMTTLLTSFSQGYIYPLGVTVDKEVVESFLDIAVKNNLITQEQRETIVSFELFRGDRRVHKSIVGKGLAFDMYEYEEKVTGDRVLFSNFPYNDLGENKLIHTDEDRGDFVEHPYDGERNDKFTFHSPEFDYYNLTIGAEAKIEAYQYGTSRGNFTEVKDHPEWVILGEKSYSTATKLALVEFGLEAAIRLAENTVQSSQGFWAMFGVSSGTGAVGAGLGLAATAGLTMMEVISSAPKIGRYRYEWLKIFRDLGKPENFASYYSSEGFYNYAHKNKWGLGDSTNYLGNTLRSVAIGKELKEGKYSINDREGNYLKINNLDREKSILLAFGEDYPIEYPVDYRFYDNGDIDTYRSSRTIQSESGACSKKQGVEVYKNVASPYVSLKNYVPFQYGSVNSIKWLPTSEKIKLDGDNDCYAVFGGDIYISRYAIKRKTPLFNDTAFGLAPLTPYEYRKNSNLGETRFYCDYELGGETSLENAFFPDFESEHKFDCETSHAASYVKAPSKFYLYYYGIPNFLVESEINLNLRYGKKELKDSFYPEVGDFTEWTQEKNVSIREPNRLFYNSAYSSSVTTASYRTLPDYYTKKEFDAIYDSPNGVIYSMQDTSENDLTDPWLVYKPSDYYQFPASYGKLIDLKGIESSQVLGRFENTTVLFNAVNQYKDAQDAVSRETGTGGIFAARPMEFSNTELGYGGSDTYQMVSNEYGHFYPDAEKGQIFQTTGKSLQEISSLVGNKPVGMKAWFKEHLPFKIKNPLVRGYESINTDNALNSVGISMGWDAKYDRVLLTKKDYIPLKEVVYTEGKFVTHDSGLSYCSYEDKAALIQGKLNEGYKFVEEDCQIVFKKHNETVLYKIPTVHCDEDSKQAEIQDLLNQGYTQSGLVDCGYNFSKEVEICSFDNKQTEIQNLLNEGYVLLSEDGCEKIFGILEAIDLGMYATTPRDAADNSYYETVWMYGAVPEVGETVYTSKKGDKVYSGDNRTSWYRVLNSPYVILVETNGEVVDRINVEQTLKVVPDNKTVTGFEGEYTFKVESNSDWKVTNTKSWIKLMLPSESTERDEIIGSGNKTIKVKYDKNTGNTDRVTSLSVSTLDNFETQYHYLNQSKISTISLDKTSHNFGRTGGSFTVTVTSSDPEWEVGTLPSWITAEKGDETVEFTVDNNPGKRTPATVSIVNFDGVSAGINMTQEDALIDVSPNLYNKSYQGGTVEVTVESSTDWSIEDDKDVVVTTKLNGRGNETFDVTVLPNESLDSREGLFKVSTLDGSISDQLKITQVGKPVELTISPNRLTRKLDSEGETFTVQVTCNTEWIIIQEIPVVTISGEEGQVRSGNGTFDITISKNPYSVVREASITVMTVDSTQSRTLTMEQEEFQHSITLTPTTKTVPPTSGTVEVEVESTTGDWTFSSQTVGWIQTERVGNKLKITYWGNEGEQRKNEITFYNGHSIATTVFTLTQTRVELYSANISSYTAGTGLAGYETNIEACEASTGGIETIYSTIPETQDQTFARFYKYVDAVEHYVGRNKWFKFGNEGRIVHIDEGGYVITEQNCNQTLTISPSNKSVNAEATSPYTVNVTSDTEWSVSGAAAWATISPREGEGNGTITITPEFNGGEETSPREVTINIRTNDWYIEREHTLTQRGTNSLYAVKISHSVETGQDSCNLWNPTTSQNYYITDMNFQLADEIYTDAGKTTKATEGFYSNGLHHRYWNGTEFTGETVYCDGVEPE